MRGARVAGIDAEERRERLELRPRAAVADGPAGVGAELLLGTALGDQRRDDDEAALAQAQLVVDPRAGPGEDRLLAEARADVVGEPRRDFLARVLSR
jgi:hypothetical protein